MRRAPCDGARRNKSRVTAALVVWFAWLQVAARAQDAPEPSAGAATGLSAGLGAAAPTGRGASLLPRAVPRTGSTDAAESPGNGVELPVFNSPVVVAGAAVPASSAAAPAGAVAPAAPLSPAGAAPPPGAAGALATSPGSASGVGAVDSKGAPPTAAAPAPAPTAPSGGAPLPGTASRAPVGPPAPELSKHRGAHTHSANGSGVVEQALPLWAQPPSDAEKRRRRALARKWRLTQAQAAAIGEPDLAGAPGHPEAFCTSHKRPLVHDHAAPQSEQRRPQQGFLRSSNPSLLVFLLTAAHGTLPPRRCRSAAALPFCHLAITSSPPSCHPAPALLPPCRRPAADCSTPRQDPDLRDAIYTGGRLHRKLAPGPVPGLPGAPPGTRTPELCSRTLILRL